LISIRKTALVILTLALTGAGFALAPTPGSAEVVQIGTAEDLLAFAERVNAGEADLDAELTADIVVEDSWVSPIGKATSPGQGYSGTFDGKSHSVSLVWKYMIDAETTNPAGAPNQTAMFNKINGPDLGVVKNLIVNVDFSTFPLTSGAHNTIAGVALQNYGRIERVAVNGSINHTATSSNANIGGIASSSYAGSEIVNCVNNAKITVAGMNAGGIAALLGGRIEGCANYGEVTNTSINSGVLYQNIGGLVGAFYDYGDGADADKALITNSYNAAKVTGSFLKDNSTMGYQGLGGLVGGINAGYPLNLELTSDHTIKNSFNYGEVWVLDSNGTPRKGAVISELPTTEESALHLDSIYYLEDSGASLFENRPGKGSTANTTLEPFGVESVREKVIGMTATEFADGTVLALLNSYEDGDVSGVGKWVQGKKFPEIRDLGPEKLEIGHIEERAVAVDPVIDPEVSGVKAAGKGETETVSAAAMWPLNSPIQNFVVPEGNLVVANKEKFAAAGAVKPLPVVRASVPEGADTVVFTLAMHLDEFAGKTVGDLVALKQKTDGVTEALARASSPSEIVGGQVAFTDENGTSLPPDLKIVEGVVYYLSVAIKDNSEYDWDTTAGSVLDPIGVTTKASPGGGGGSGGGGCDAGFAGFGLLMLALVAAKIAGKKR
jgi:hypothetical protein